MSFDPFPLTRWTLILSAKDGEAAASCEAMESLVKAYWQPIYAWIRGRGRSHEEAQDDTQGFFAYLLDRRFFDNLQPEGGRFRNFLLVCLRRWMKDESNLALNLKRRAEVEWPPFHEKEVPEFFSTAASPEEAFDRTWVAALVARTMAALEQRWENRAELFAALRLTVESPGDAEKYAPIGARLGLTENAVAKAACDLRRQFAEQIRREVRDTVATDEDVMEELRYLARLMHT